VSLACSSLTDSTSKRPKAKRRQLGGKRNGSEKRNKSINVSSNFSILSHLICLSVLNIPLPAVLCIELSAVA
jgi:hypothetical protein